MEVDTKLNRFLRGIVLALMLLFLPPAYSNERAPTVNPSAVGVSTPFSYCSGFIGEFGKVVTAAHCVIPGVDTYLLNFYDGTLARGTLIYTDPDDDWAVLSFDNQKHNYPSVTLNPVLPRLNEPVDHYRSTHLDDTQILSPGIMMEEVCERDVKGVKHCIIYFSGIAVPGDSGGPLFNSHGEVIGIVVMTMQPTLPIGLATPIDEVYEWLKYN